MDETVIEKGDYIEVDYVGKLTDGKVFDTSLQQAAKEAGLSLRPMYSPLGFTVGAGQMIAGFDSGVIGMHKGETRELKIAPSQAYGEKVMRQVFPLAEFRKAGIPAQAGTKISTGAGVGTVTAVKGNDVEVEIQNNHALAGKTLVFTVTVVRIKKGGK